MKFPGLLLAASMAFAWSLPAPAAGCQYDMQCKGERICQQGQCVSPEPDEQVDPAAKSAPTAPAAAKTHTPAASPRGCCTVSGKMKLAPASANDPNLAIGDACQGLTASGKPVPGTICN